MPNPLEGEKASAFVKSPRPEISDFSLGGPRITEEATEEAVRTEALHAERQMANRAAREI